MNTDNSLHTQPFIPFDILKYQVIPKSIHVAIVIRRVCRTIQAYVDDVYVPNRVKDLKSLHMYSIDSQKAANRIYINNFNFQIIAEILFGSIVESSDVFQSLLTTKILMDFLLEDPQVYVKDIPEIVCNVLENKNVSVFRKINAMLLIVNNESILGKQGGKFEMQTSKTKIFHILSLLFFSRSELSWDFNGVFKEAKHGWLKEKETDLSFLEPSAWEIVTKININDKDEYFVVLKYLVLIFALIYFTPTASLEWKKIALKQLNKLSQSKHETVLANIGDVICAVSKKSESVGAEDKENFGVMYQNIQNVSSKPKCGKMLKRKFEQVQANWDVRYQERNASVTYPASKKPRLN